MITFVVFHVGDSRQAGRVEHVLGQDATYERMIDIAFRSAAVFNERCRKVVLTDSATAFPEPLDRAVEILRIAAEADGIMLRRLRAQLDFLRGHDFASHVVFMDSDILVNAPLEGVFDGSFDVALTYREDDEMPINGGLLLVAREAREAAIRFFEQLLDVYQNRFMDYAHWWGDQHALIEVVGRENYERRVADHLVSSGVRVRLLPCSQYNFTPRNRLVAIAEPLSGKSLLHFKADKKWLMPIYWDAYLARRERASPRVVYHALRPRLLMQGHLLAARARRLNRRFRKTFGLVQQAGGS